MSEKPELPVVNGARIYLFVGIAFLGAGALFLISRVEGIWIAFLALGLAFLVLSSAGRARAARAAEPTDPTPDGVPPADR